jgi:hypothetical protein
LLLGVCKAQDAWLVALGGAEWCWWDECEHVGKRFGEGVFTVLLEGLSFFRSYVPENRGRAQPVVDSLAVNEAFSKACWPFVVSEFHSLTASLTWSVIDNCISRG